MTPSRLLAIAALVALFPSCQQKFEGALRVEVTTSAQLKADCLRVTVSNGDTELRWATFKRGVQGEKQEVAVARADGWPSTVSISGSGWLGSDCADETTLKRNSGTAKQVVTFPANDVLPVGLFIDVPTAADDGDRDGYSEGPDCRDSDPTFYPGSVQVCMRDEDTDCDGQAGCADPDCGSALPCANPPDRLLLEGVPTTTDRNRCLDIGVALRNPAGLRAATTPIVVNLTGSAGVVFFEGSGCAGSPVSQTTIPFLAPRAIVSMKPTAAGLASLGVASPGLTGASTTFIVAPLQWTSLQLTNVPTSQPAGTCGDPFTLSLLDASNQPTTVAQALTVVLTNTPSDSERGSKLGGFFATDDCSGGALTTVDVPAGAGEVRLRYRGTIDRSVELRASVGPTKYATATMRITALAGTKLAFRNGRLALRTSTCSASALTVEVRDQFDNPTTSPTTVQLTPSAPDVTFYADSACTPQNKITSSTTLGAGAASAEFYLWATVSGGDRTVTVTPNMTFAPISQLFDVSTEPTSLVFANSPRTATAGECSAELTLELRDVGGVLSSFTVAQDVTLDTTSTLPAGSNFNFFTAAGCTGAAVAPGAKVIFPGGQSQTRLYFKGEKTVASFAVSAALMSLTATSPGHRIDPSTPSILQWTPPGTTSAKAGACSDSYTLAITDRYGNPTTFGSSVPVSVSPAGLTYSAPTCGAGAPAFLANNPTLSLQARGTTVNTYALSATAGGAATSATAPFTVTPGDPATLTQTWPLPSSVVAGDCQQLRFELKDAFGNVASGTPLTVTFAADAGLTVHRNATDCTNSAGASTSFPVDAGVRSVWAQPRRVHASGVPVTGTIAGVSETATLNVTAAPAATLNFQGLPTGPLSAAACSGPVSLGRLDAFGNPATNDGALTAAVVVGTGAQVTATSDCSGAPSTSASASFVAGQAQSSAFSVSAAPVGTYSVRADAGVPLVVASNFSVIAGPPAKLAFTSTTPTSLEAATCSSDLAVRVSDAQDNVLTTNGLTVNLSSAPASVTFSPAASACAGSATSAMTVGGIATFSFRAPNVPQALTISASSPGFALPATQSWSIAAGPPRQLVWKVAPPATLNRFTCSNAVTLQLQDWGGNAVAASSALAFTLTTSSYSPGLEFYSDATCTTKLPGAGDVSIAGGATEVSFYVSATGNGSASISNTGAFVAPVSSITVSGTAQAMTLTAASPHLEAGGCMQVTAARTGLTVGTSVLTVSGQPAAVTLHTASNCSSASEVASFTIPNGSDHVDLYAQGHSVSTDTSFTLIAEDASGGLANSNGVAMTTYPLVRRGTCDIARNDPSSTCAVPSPTGSIDRTFLVFQAVNDTTNANETLARCYLKPGPVEIVCARGAAHNSVVSVSWQTVSWGRSFAQGGVSVQHLQGSITNGTASPVTRAVAAVSMGQAFVLFSSNSGRNGVPDVGDFYTAKLSSATQVTFTNSTTFPATDYALQVVEFAGTTVTRGSMSNVAVAPSATETRTPFDSPTHSPLFSSRSEVSGAPNACKFRLRGYVSGDDFVVWRGRNLSTSGMTPPLTTCANAAVAEVAWEVVQWPSGVTLQRTSSMSPLSIALTASSATWTPATTVVPHRTLVYMPGQGASGQASGETGRYDGNEAGTGLATLSLSGTTVTVTHAALGSATGNALFTPYAVTFAP